LTTSTAKKAIRGAGVARALRFSDVTVGASISATELPLTLQRLVIEAGVNRDYTPTHHDRELAVASGAPAPYANTPMIMALLEAGLRNWMGAEGRLLELNFKMRKFNVAGSLLKVGGRVTATGSVDPEFALDQSDWGEVSVECWIESESGRTVECMARVALRKTRLEHSA
jgi:acyl dehydratase